MAKFSGIQISTLDDKGRTSIPVKMRDVLVSEFADDRVVLTKAAPVRSSSGEICRGLSLYPLREFAELEERLDRQSGLSAAELKSVRNLIIAPAEICTFDRQGRVLVPPSLRSYALLEREVVFVGGQNTKIDLWNPSTWEKVSRQAEEDFPADSPILAELGL
ncbi:MAG: division/cell wall cluster transcriptional repressor MraZ [Desulfuromonadia bacterium]